MAFFGKKKLILSENVYIMKNLKLIPVGVLAVAIIAAAVMLILREDEYLWKVQELNLFLDTALFFKQQLVVPGGCLIWICQFFTQFFHHTWMGVALLALWWAIHMAVAANTFRMPMKWLTVLLVPLALFFIAIVGLEYWVYYLKLPGHVFAPVVGTTLAIAWVWAFRKVTAKFQLRLGFMLGSAFVAYPLMGAYGLFAIILMAAIAWRLDDLNATWRTVYTAVAVIAVWGVPLVCYRTIYCQTSLEGIYFAALPVFAIDKFYTSYYVPYALLALFYLVAAFTFKKRDVHQEVKRWGIWNVAQAGLLALVIYGVGRYWHHDYNFHKELRMQRCMEQSDWNGILAQEISGDDEPTRAIVMMRNLALARLGRQGDEMYHYRIGSKKSNAPFPVKMTQVAGKSIYFHYGQANYCYRWCLEDGVEQGWRAEYLKYLTRCSIVNGEYKVARKYIDMLKHTLFFAEWAERQEALMADKKALKADPAYGPVFHMMGYNDRLTSDRALVEYFLYFELANIDSDDPILQEQTLIAAMWTKDIATFWPKFFKYLQLHSGQRMPIHYQEAALLYGNLEHQVDISKMPFDQTVVNTYQNFMARAQQYAGMSEEMMKERFYPEFGHTFYYEYFLNRKQELY